MGHLRKRKLKNGDTRYQMIVEIWKNGEQFYKTKTFKTEKDAIKWGNKTTYEIEQGLVTKESLKPKKLSEAIKRYLKDVIPEESSNFRNVEQHLKWWNSQIGNRQLIDVSAKEIAECRDKLLKEPSHKGSPRAPATVVRYLSSISSVLDTAIKEWHWIEKNPVKLIKKPKVSNARTRFLSEDECQRLLDSCKESRNPYLHSIVLIALGTGMRRGEILGMLWEDIDFTKRLITLPKTKNGSIRYVPMVGITYHVLKKLYDAEKEIEPSFHIFPSLNLKRYIDIRSAWIFALKRASIKDFTFHSLRHSCASFLSMSGASQRDIAEILGHKDLRMTHRYSHLAQNHLAETLEKASDKFLGQEL